LMIIISPWRSSKTRFDMRLFLVWPVPAQEAAEAMHAGDSPAF
jgi:hypothetical protein